MKFLLRPSLLVAISLMFVLGAVAVWFRFRPETSGPMPPPPVPLSVAPVDREIVWLYQATSTATWERFVTAVKLTEERLRDRLPGIKAIIEDQAFPSRSTTVPEVALTWNEAGGRIVFRWYKLTSDWKPRDWVRALLKDRPPPLAILGGSSSDGARDLAVQLRTATADLTPEKRPLLILTTATADLVDWPADEPQPADLVFQDPVAAGQPVRVSLNAIYPERTLRFCFNNRQMSEAVTQFLWSRDDLRPDSDHAYMIQWNDDTYSRDLVEGFGRSSGQLLGDSASFTIENILSSFGTSEANRFEVEHVGRLLTAVENNAETPILLTPSAKRKHSLLVVAGQTPQTRRFLHELARTYLKTAHGFVVATGDSLAFNTIYRDRLITWPIQDLPYPLVLFSHANPVDHDAGFRPHPEGKSGTTIVGDSGATGTEDVLLFAEIIGALAQGAAVADGPLANAPALLDRLRGARYGGRRIKFGAEGTLLFAPNGDRADGTGEHVICLLPQFQGGRALALLGGSGGWIGAGMPPIQGGRVLPRAIIEVWTWRDRAGIRKWESCCEPLAVSYGEKSDSGGNFHE